MSEFVMETDREDESSNREVLQWYSRSDCEEGNPAATHEGTRNVSVVSCCACIYGGSVNLCSYISQSFVQINALNPGIVLFGQSKTKITRLELCIHKPETPSWPYNAVQTMIMRIAHE